MPSTLCTGSKQRELPILEEGEKIPRSVAERMSFEAGLSTP
eukprot:CAMPEP_0178443952 /NCGR_PEP_ID=MMETSP0689_2-20121128/39209_1 /TAXON_ID=160604 /ORGANISM="Amphidinium massartii, Strain CS-259" /LENGTH=40 /DNA_ID= /DNA_START= /DNA_END= /DNA_ORIENTATION=